MFVGRAYETGSSENRVSILEITGQKLGWPCILQHPHFETSFFHRTQLTKYIYALLSSWSGAAEYWIWHCETTW